MDILYKGFDGLDVAFRALTPLHLAEVLEQAKNEAAALNASVLIEYENVQMHVSAGGGPGGYAYRCDTGPFGITWFFKKPNGRDPWGIRASSKSLPLAMFGLGGVRAQMIGFLDALGIRIPDGGESIGRVDYAIDLLLPDFVIEPDNFVMHSHTNRSDHKEILTQRTNGVSGRITSVTVGKMPQRQVIIYDKRLEVIRKQKVYWWEIWNAGRKVQGKSKLDPKDRDASRIIRVEVRAGKADLKRRWNVAMWSELDDLIGDVFLKTLQSIRYSVPTPDTNRSRWPDHLLWKTIRTELSGDLFEMISGVEPELIRSVLREQLQTTLHAQMIGLAATYGIVCGVSSGDAEMLPSLITKELEAYLSDEHDRFVQKMVRAEERYVFL